MKVLREVEIDLCDICKKKEASEWRKCGHCGTVFCSDCEDLHTVTYHVDMFGDSSRDVKYCFECEKTLKEEEDPGELFMALRGMQELRKRWKEQSEDMEVRRKFVKGSIDRILIRGY